MKKSILIPTGLVLTLLAMFSVISAQQSVAEKLGYPAHTKLLIVHADDIGLAQSVNEASLKAF